MRNRHKKAGPKREWIAPQPTGYPKNRADNPESKKAASNVHFERSTAFWSIAAEGV
jgi:hypothetical protein